MDFTAALKNWVGQSTTGQGIGVGVAAVAASTQGAPNWVSIGSGIVSVILMLWPQKHDNIVATAQAAVPVATDFEKMLEVYKLGISHGQTPAQAVVAVAPQVAATVVDVEALASALWSRAPTLVSTAAVAPPPTVAGTGV
jgi:uncharacterized protein (DUF1786 family)